MITLTGYYDSSTMRSTTCDWSWMSPSVKMTNMWYICKDKHYWAYPNRALRTPEKYVGPANPVLAIAFL
jgi:hypothetical protein